MRKLLAGLSMLCTLFFAQAQELDCTIIINAEQTARQSGQVFKTLERSLNDYMNKTVWTDKVYAANERINCSMIITVTEYNATNFTASIQVQSTRPVINSTYNTPIFNFNDKDFSFEYTEFQNLQLNPNQFDSNLVSVMAYYAYMIIGMDADTFEFNGGTPYYDQANNIVNVAQTSSFVGWNTTDRQSRYELIKLLQSPSYKVYRTILYRYHIYALDMMAENQKTAKERLVVVIKQFEKLHRRNPSSFLQRTFFDAKSDEISDIFSDGPSVKITDLLDVLNKVSPNNSSKWSKIKF